MSKDIYERLREHLDKLPWGMPKTQIGVELEILQEIFSPDEAEMALNLTAIPESVQEIASRAKKSITDVANIINTMVKDGLIFWAGEKGNRKYNLMPFCPGIIELQLNRLNKELALKVGEYLNLALTRDLIGTDKTPLFRVVPVNQKAPHDLYVFPYDKVASIIESADFICLTKCYCRTNKEAEGKFCGASRNTCLLFGDYGKMFVDNGLGEAISKERALDVLRRSEEEGLVHSTFNTAKNNLYICNCCRCCCSFLRALTRLNIPTAIVKSDYMIEIDVGRCVACETCVDRCPMKAVSIGDAGSVVDRNRCIGCGVCILACPTEARRLVRKEPEERVPPLESPEVAFERLRKEKGKALLVP